MDRKKLFKTWIFVILALLIVVFYEIVSLFAFDSILYWIRLLAILAIILFTFYMVYTQDNYSTSPKPQNKDKWYADEILKRDKEIEDLKKEKDLLFKTSMKQSEHASKWSDYAKRLEKQIPK